MIRPWRAMREGEIGETVAGEVGCGEMFLRSNLGVVSRGSTFQLSGPRELESYVYTNLPRGECRLKRADEAMRRLFGWSASCFECLDRVHSRKQSD